MSSIGTVYWITGLSGAGKTTIGKLLYDELNREKPTIFLDGDMLREIYGDGIGYTLEERKKMAMRNARLCAMLATQGFDVVCCTIAMFHSVRQWNREVIAQYKEIYLKVSYEVLMERDQKKLYSGSKLGKSKNVMGIDLDLEEPIEPDAVIKNDGILTPLEVLDIIKKLTMEGAKNNG